MAARKTPQTAVDWEAVERDYRTGRFTSVELSKAYGLTRRAISKHAEAHGWVKDLTAAVRVATAAKLMRAEAEKSVRQQVAQGVAQQVAQQVALAAGKVDSAAEVNTTVILRHRSDIRRARDLAMAMIAELALATTSPDMIRQAAQLAALGGDVTDEDLRAAQAALAKHLLLSSRVASMQRLADTLTKLQSLERTAFALDEQPAVPPEKRYETMSDDDLLKRMAELGLRDMPAVPAVPAPPKVTASRDAAWRH